MPPVQQCSPSYNAPRLIHVGIDDDIMRRDSMHATINALPDPHYATLRALTLVRKLLLRACTKR